jgi:transcriptional regulator with XRE-family HTH domain
MQPTMRALQFQDRLHREFQSRRQINPRYSLRAFAAFLGADHSTLSQVLRGRRSVPLRQLRRWGKNLGIPSEEIAAYIAAQYVPHPSIRERQEQLRHWTSEALAIMNHPTHWQLVRLSQRPEFRPDCRWVAKQIGVSIDEVHIALSRLLQLRLLQIGRTARWEVLLTGSERISEDHFRKLALTRVRERAAAYGVQLGRFPRKGAADQKGHF